jgi:hypothetical protein
MLWVFSRLISEIQSKGRIQLIENKALQSNEEWQTHADKKMQQTWNQFLTKVEVLEAADTTKALKSWSRSCLQVHKECTRSSLDSVGFCELMFLLHLF